MVVRRPRTGSALASAAPPTLFFHLFRPQGCARGQGAPRARVAATLFRNPVFPGRSASGEAPGPRRCALVGARFHLAARAGRRDAARGVDEPLGLDGVVRAGGTPVQADVPDQAELGAIGRGGRLVGLGEGALELLGEVAQVGMAVALEGHGHLVLIARGEAGRVVPAGDHVVDVALVHVHMEAHARRVVVVVVVGDEGL
eukprot:CAMPEP_0118845396 /NCGR_PEP_ID=MMETSP1162-20130426/89025_1 /TAXON_ID=33656 /ORGANISM="Phaeocystis Sp, Strain CCMP2710" /LENGTH=199 /DNA_ID=CAMNT_0006777543 /DNA_START=38 /DNA_END=633 /DNA_ORIENTATION=-